LATPACRQAGNDTEIHGKEKKIIEKICHENRKKAHIYQTEWQTGIKTD